MNHVDEDEDRSLSTTTFLYNHVNYPREFKLTSLVFSLSSDGAIKVFDSDSIGAGHVDALLEWHFSGLAHGTRHSGIKLCTSSYDREHQAEDRELIYYQKFVTGNSEISEDGRNKTGDERSDRPTVELEF